MFQKIDWFFLSHFEKGCHFLQKMTGKTNYYYVGLCSFLIVLISLGVYFDIFPKGLIGEGGLIYNRNDMVWFWVNIFIFTFFSSSWKIIEAWAYTNLNNGVANICKIMHTARLARILLVIMLPFVLLLPVPQIQIYDKVFIVLVTLVLFLLSCDPLPPCTGKVKEWLKSFGKKPALVAAKTGE